MYYNLFLTKFQYIFHNIIVKVGWQNLFKWPQPHPARPGILQRASIGRSPRSRPSPAVCGYSILARQPVTNTRICFVTRSMALGYQQRLDLLTFPKFRFGNVSINFYTA